MRFAILPALLCLLAPTHVFAEGTIMTRSSIYDVPVLSMQSAGGTTVTLAPYKGDVLLLVNVASKCGYTPQYKALEELHKKYSDKGLKVLGFPCNDYHGQEPGTEEEIVKFCSATYGADFPLYAKLHTIGADQAPLYKYLTGEGSPFPGDVKWNFEKFLISRDGKIIARYKSAIKPDSPELVAAVEKELAAK